MIRPTIGARSSSTVYAPGYQIATRASYVMAAIRVHRGRGDDDGGLARMISRRRPSGRDECICTK